MRVGDEVSFHRYGVQQRGTITEIKLAVSITNPMAVLKDNAEPTIVNITTYEVMFKWFGDISVYRTVNQKELKVISR